MIAKRISLLSLLGLLPACADTQSVTQTADQEVVATPGPVEELQASQPAESSPYRYLQLQGPLTESDMQRAFDQNRKALNRCYREVIGVSLQERDKENDWARIEPGLSEAGAELDGIVVFYFQVAAEGQVQNLRISRSDFRQPEFQNCMELAVQKIQFPVQDQDTKVKNLVLSFSHETGVGNIR
jgi:hypothetical protein